MSSVAPNVLPLFPVDRPPRELRSLTIAWGVLLVGGACEPARYGTDGDPAGPCPSLDF